MTGDPTVVSARLGLRDAAVGLLCCSKSVPVARRVKLLSCPSAGLMSTCSVRGPGSPAGLWSSGNGPNGDLLANVEEEEDTGIS